MENLESQGILLLHFPGLESHGKGSTSLKVMESHGISRVVSLCKVVSHINYHA
jgi:hypothetical protein